MDSALNEELLALETLESLVAALKSSDDGGGQVVERLIRAIEDDRAALLASILQAQAVKRPPARTHRPVR